MGQQPNSWSCSVMSFQWVIQATATDTQMTYDEALGVIGYPQCVNSTYGLMSADCMINAFSAMGLKSIQKWVTYNEAYSIMRITTGVINPIGMYHFMGMRGVGNIDISSLWVANSAPGYDNIYSEINRSQFNSLGPVQLIYLE